MAESKPETKKFADRYQISPVTALYALLKDYFLAIFGAAVFALILRVYVVEAFRIPTDFMVPTLLPGDHILVSKLAYGGVFGLQPSKPARGDVIIFTFPNDPTKDYIKRVLAVEGDTVEIKNSLVLLNGKAVSRVMEPNLYEEDLGDKHYYVQWKGAAPEARAMSHVKVPEGQVFVLGDNRAKGQDSRSFGFLPLSNIKGKASRIFFSVGTTPGTGGAINVRWSRLFTKVN